MSRSLYTTSGEPSEALRAALVSSNSADYTELLAKAAKGTITRDDLLGYRLGGTHAKPGLVARVLFGRPKPRPYKRRALSTRRGVGQPLKLVAPAPAAPEVDEDHERVHLALFTD